VAAAELAVSQIAANLPRRASFSLNLDKAKDLTSSNRCHDQCKDKNPRDVALLYQLISNAMDSCQHERSICHL
jgi:hypothetical protein